MKNPMPRRGRVRSGGFRRSFPALLATAFAAVLAACVAAPSTIAPAAVASAADLTANAGHAVQVTGERRGPAKLGDFIAVGDEQVYVDAGVAGDVPYGAALAVTGTLRHVEPPAEPGCGEGCERAEMPAHWRLDAARRVR